MLLKCIIGSFAHFLFFGIIVVSVIPSMLMYVVMYIIGKDRKDYFQKIFAFGNKIFFIIVPKIVVKIKNQKTLPESAVYIATHQSILDYPILTLFVPKHTMLAKINFKTVPFVTFFSNLVGVESLAGQNIEELGKMYQKFEEKLNQGRNMILFPEGTRHTTNYLKPFKRGAFRLAFKADKPVVPVVIEGLTKILPRKSFCFITSQKTLVNVTVLDPLYPKDFASDLELMKHAQKIMQTEKDRLCDIS